MKKLIVPTLCVLVGCAAGTMIPAVTAQWADNPQAQRWQQECAGIEPSASGRTQRLRANELLRERGAEGWELVAVGEGFLNVCFKRPAP